MKSIEQLIGDLLLRHNCVIVPSFGGFVAKPISAKIDFEKGTMLPPSKSLLFNKQLINNDGLLINELAQENATSFNEAASAVGLMVKEWHSALKTGKRIELDRIGILYFDEEQNICFEQDRFFNLLLESFGLGQVHFLAEEDAPAFEPKINPVEKIIPTTVLLEKETPIIPISTSVQPKIVAIDAASGDNKKIRKRKIRRYVAAACFLPFAFYTIWIPVKTDVLESGVISIKDFNPFHTAEEGGYEKDNLIASFNEEQLERTTLEEEINALPTTVEVYSYKFDEDFYIPVKTNDSEVEVSASNNQNLEVITLHAMNYIVGCFGDKSNADNLVAKLNANGLNARILDTNKGLHRVTAGSAASVEALQNIKSQIEGLGMIGWTLK